MLSAQRVLPPPIIASDGIGIFDHDPVELDPSESCCFSNMLYDKYDYWHDWHKRGNHTCIVCIDFVSVACVWACKKAEMVSLSGT